jgi:outer membrane biosynthesis protein TonB
MTTPKKPAATPKAATKPAAKPTAKKPAPAKPRAAKAKTAAEVAPENEVMRETRAAIAHKETGANKGSAAAKLDWKTAAGIGVGSAAVIAALLYANRGKK